MTKETKINLAIGAVLIFALYYINKNRTPQIDASKLNRDLVLSYGSKGAEVLELQRRMKDVYNADLGDTGENHDGVDGNFGNLTMIALRKFRGSGVSSTTLNKFQ
jgi:hypothetical protein